jgi:TonB family protein
MKPLIFWLILVFAVLPSCAQTTENDISARLKGNPLYLRGMWGDDHLSFDADGRPQKAYHAITFTECGFQVKSIKMQKDKLRIEGQRMALEFFPDGKMKRINVEANSYNGHMTIEVQGAPGTDFGKALDAIFAPDLASITPDLPDYWQDFARRMFLPAGATPAAAGPASDVDRRMQEIPSKPGKGSSGKAMHVGGSVKPPRVLKSVEPDFSEVARAMKFSGNVQVYLWVDESGMPSHLKIVRPAGLGLDEKALAAVQQYKFSPAMQDGKPVKVDLYVDVNFQIF